MNKLVNSLFMTDLYGDEKAANMQIGKTVSITSRTAELEEKGVRLKLTVVDTPGFGEAINNQKWYFIHINNSNLKKNLFFK